jgi:hypothetical protein
MKAGSHFRMLIGMLYSAAMVFAFVAASFAAPTFISHDPRLPNPDHPYVMKDRADYGPVVSIDDLMISVANPEQLDTPTVINGRGDWSFDSTFDVRYSAILSIGLAPPQFVTGTGSAHAVGVAPGGGPILAQLVYNTELLALDLDDPPGFKFRESPVLRSTGVTTAEDLCLVCGAPISLLRISSYFDVYSEVSIDGGTTWVPASGAFRIEPTPEPATIWLALLCGAGIWSAALSCKRPRGARR